MPYITKPLGPRYSQMSTFEDLMENLEDLSAPEPVNFNPTNTRTDFVSVISFPSMNEMLDRYVNTLWDFNQRHADLFLADMHTLYRTFPIPKRSGGVRIINAPEPPLMEALRELSMIFQNQFGILYHTSAFAYVRHRCAVDAVKRHQRNESRWFLKLDFHDFFGSTTPEFVMRMLSQIWPFSGIVTRPRGLEGLRMAVSLCFLDGGLPQGTPISPMLTNIMMVPIDHQLCNGLQKFNDGNRDVRFVYTRYADDLQISSKVDFNKDAVISYVKGALASFGAPMQLNDRKTRYGSSAGSNWNLGVMLNAKNEITIGHKNKKLLEAMLTNYCRSRLGGTPWELAEVQALQGKISYYKMIERESITRIINEYSEKFGINIERSMKEDISA